MKRFRKNDSIGHKLLSLVLAIMVLSSAIFTAAPITSEAATTITSMSYYSSNDGPVISKSDAVEASYGFVMPIFNGGAATFNDVADDLAVNVKVNGAWVDIDSVASFIYNSNWGHWNDAGFTGYWFVVSETTYIQLASKSNPSVALEYTLEFTKLASATITSMTPTQGPELTAGVTGGSGFTYPTFNGDSSIVYSQIADDLAVYVWSNDSQSWVNLENNAASGWIYDQNWGQFWDGPGGYWFTVTETTKVRLQSKSNSNVYLDYTINYSQPVRNSYTLTANGATTYTAGDDGAIGMPLPFIDGGNAYQSELAAFVYEILINGEWVALSDTGKSGFTYRSNGYTQTSAANQWGYWVDGIYGLWFQPIQEDMQIRIGYPTDGVAGNAVNNNYVYYTFIGNPNAPRPDPVDYAPIDLGTTTNAGLDGWNLIWNDEFNGNSLDTTKWSYQIGNGLTASGNTGWGNDELEYYTNSSDNVYVQNGALNITALQQTVTDPNEGTFNITSGRLRSVSDNRTLFAFKYGRVDFCAKLPDGAGIWPALWMLPSDTSIYGVWAASGEIDVMEARGRVTNSTCGTIHYGGTWPANDHLGGDYFFPDGSTFDDGYHVYSLVWEQDKLKWYVDGQCFYALSNDNWFSTAAPNNPYAPFDQEFYILMNVAAGGWFDGGIAPNASAFPATMQVEYVRVYQAEGDTLATYTDNSSGIDSSTGTIPPTTQPATQPATQPTTQPATQPATQPSTQPSIGDGNYGVTQSGNTATFYVNNAEFADIHYIVNGGAQNNVGMTNTSGTSNYTYNVSGLNPGDVIQYFFTYKPMGEGALDTAWFTYTVPSSGTQQPSTEATTVAPTEPATEPSTSPSVGDGDYGVTQVDNDTINFYVNKADWAIVHYTVNDGDQLNVGMTGSGTYTYEVSGLNPGDVVKYFFTYMPTGAGALDTGWFTYTIPSGPVVDNTSTVTFINGSNTYYTVDVTNGSAVTLPSAPSKDGSLFIGWFNENVGTVTSVNNTLLSKAYNTNATVNTDTTLYAGWLSTGTITADAKDGSAGSNTSGFYLVGAQYRKLSSSAPAGLRFVARISDSLVSSVEALNPANASLQPDSSADTGIGYGMVVTTANRLSSTNMLIKDLSAANVVKGMKVCPAVNTYRKYNGYSLYTAVVTGITEASYDVNIAARMYITYKDANGVEQTYYYTENESASRVGGAYYTTYRKVMNA